MAEKPRREIRRSRGALPRLRRGDPSGGDEQRSQRIVHALASSAGAEPEMGRMGAEDPPRAFPSATLVDTHLHLEELGEPNTVVEAAVGAGVTRLIAMGTDLERSRGAVSLANRFQEVWAGVGHYPLEPSAPDVYALRELAADEMVVAIGEIGLDFEHVGGPDRDVQRQRLDDMFALALELDLPVSIHNRGADAEVADAISRHRGLRGVMHYFALNWEWAERFLSLGFYLSFAGLITRPSRATLREVVVQCPADRLLLETDSPYGNAQSRMGVPNRPEYLLDIAGAVAELRGVSLAELAERETSNAYALFRKMK